ncbi:hypothetical protein AKJ65_07800 [candidate division MSBL1 archaeon SCGC-AAA259E19]|uniref:DNA topoisomerase type IA zn finger domain-containing protein n=1 Tax=candidate division MSBL1 archaeon SCGC-AAA259E19 TaxID=1698264 RepID=A0A133UDM8_9EURY|nr:hypothetical protein AKJ65_07800 [candidate division MSBL1 archaeon SCGC-AAA259E19]
MLLSPSAPSFSIPKRQPFYSNRGTNSSVSPTSLQPGYPDRQTMVVKELGSDFEAEWVPRERNEEADALSKEAFEDYVRTHDYEFNGHPLIRCDKCGAWMVARRRKYGMFYGCSRYPKCKNTKSLEYVEK